MSAHNRRRKQLFKLGLSRKQIGFRLTGPALVMAITMRKRGAEAVEAAMEWSRRKRTAYQIAMKMAEEAK